MTPDTARKLALAIDAVEADLVWLQSRLYSVRQVLERVVGKPVGFDYSKPNERSAEALRGPEQV